MREGSAMPAQKNSVAGTESGKKLMGEMRCARGEGLPPRAKASPARSAMYAGLGSFSGCDTLGTQGWPAASWDRLCQAGGDAMADSIANGV